MAKTVMIQADKARNLKYGINQMVELEELLGKPVTNMDMENFSMKDLRAMVYVGLKWEDKKLTQEIAGDIMDTAIENDGIESLSASIGKAMELAFNKVVPPSK